MITIAKAVLAALFVAAGMGGYYMGIEESFLLFIFGGILALSLSDD